MAKIISHGRNNLVFHTKCNFFNLMISLLAISGVISDLPFLIICFHLKTCFILEVSSVFDHLKVFFLILEVSSVFEYFKTHFPRSSIHGYFKIYYILLTVFRIRPTYLRIETSSHYLADSRTYSLKVLLSVSQYLLSLAK